MSSSYSSFFLEKHLGKKPITLKLRQTKTQFGSMTTKVVKQVIIIIIII